MHITKWKKPTWKGYILYYSNYITFWKKQNHEDSEKITGLQELRVRERNEQAENRGLLGQ